MEPKLKALQIIIKMQFQKEPLSFAQGKKCALIAVDELISISLPSSEFGGVISNNTTEYWNEVKKEIEKL
jgi:hypothetical protein